MVIRPQKVIQQEDAIHTLAAVAKHANLDEKQQLAFQVICTTFMLSWLEELFIKDQHRTACGAASAGLSLSVSNEYKDTVALLKKHGARSNLFMYLSGAGGSGKSHVVHASRRFCSDFCCKSGLPFEDNAIYLTAASGSAAALLGGGTLHEAAGLNRKKIPQDMKDAWESVRILIINEESYMSVSDWENLDRKCRLLKREPGKMYGGINIVAIGDKHQFYPVGGDPVFKV